MVDRVVSRSSAELPITMPITAPAQTAIARPSAQLSRVLASAVQKLARSISSASVSMMVLNGGK